MLLSNLMGILFMGGYRFQAVVALCVMLAWGMTGVAFASPYGREDRSSWTNDIAITTAPFMGTSMISHRHGMMTLTICVSNTSVVAHTVRLSSGEYQQECTVAPSMSESLHFKILRTSLPHFFYVQIDGADRGRFYLSRDTDSLQFLLSPFTSKAEVIYQVSRLFVNTETQGQRTQPDFRDRFEKKCHWAEGNVPVPEWPSDWLAYTPVDAVILTRDEWAGAPEGVRSALLKYLHAGGQLVLAGGDDADIDFPAGLGAAGTLPDADVKAWTTNDFVALHSVLTNASFQWMPILHSRCPYPTEASFAKPPIVPVYVALIVIMALLGPVLLIVLARRDERIHAYWLVPSIAGAIFVIILALAFAREGIRVKSYAQSALYLNEAAQTQAHLTTLSMMTPIGLRSPLRFAGTVEVTPAPSGREFSSGRTTVRNAGDLVLSSTWVPPRVPITFLLREAAALTAPRPAFAAQGGTVTATNPYTVPLRNLLYCDAAGACFAHEGPLAAGASAALAPLPAAADAKRRPAAEILKNVFFRAAPLDWPLKPPPVLPPKAFICELEGSPFLEHPLRNSTIRHEGRTLVMGELQ